MQIKVDRIAIDGDGVGRLTGAGDDKGQVAFVPYTLPGEVVDARLVLKKKHLSHWLPVGLKDKSPDRITPPCPYHFKIQGGPVWCGGCNWQEKSISFQRAAKRQLVVEALERLGGIQKPPVGDVISSPLEWRYRNKVQVPFGVKNGKLVAGFFAPGSHEIVTFDDCLIQSEPSVDVLRFIKSYAEAARWRAYDEDRKMGWIRHVLLRTNQKGECLAVIISAHPSFPDKNEFVNKIRQKFPFIIGLHQNVQPAPTHVILGRQWIHLWGETRIEEDVLGLRIQTAPGSFVQVNKGAADRLYEKTIEELRLSKDSVVVDLYAGAGALTLLAARKCKFAVGVEEVPSAVEDAERNAKLNGISNVEFVRATVESFCDRDGFERRGGGDPILLLDPPRAGCDPKVLAKVLSMKPVRIVYVSCHPATLARDIKILSTQYRLESNTPVDLFPQTSHIESVSRLERRSQR